LLLVWGIFSTAVVQDERALELLRALTAPADTPTDTNALETFDYTLRYSIYSDRTAKAADTRVRFAVDVGRRRLYTESVVGRTTNTKLIYKDGQATAYDLRAGETFTPPEELVAPFTKWFEQARLPHIRAQDLNKARYNGVKRYGGLVQGEEVEVTAVLPDFLGTSLGRVRVKLLFNRRGDHLASIYTVEGEEVLMVYTDPGNPAPLPRYLNARLYKLGAGDLFLEARTVLEHLSVNKPLDERLFDVGAAQGSR